MALSAVVLPAPLGPMSPRIRPSSTRRFTPSSAMVVPKALRRPRASMHAMASTFLLLIVRTWRSVRRAAEQFFRLEAEALNSCVNPGPFLAEKFLAFALEQQIARAGIDEHAATSPGFDQPFVHQLLVALQDRERIDPIIGGNIAHGGQGIA